MIEQIDIEKTDIVIGENEYTYLMNNINLQNLSSLDSNLDLDLFRISKATEKIEMKECCTYIINAKYKYNIKLNPIKFHTEEFFNDEIIYNGKLYNLNDKSRFIKFHFNLFIKVRFVIDSFYLEKILEEYKIPSFTVSTGRNSNVSINDAKSAFDDINIVDIFCEKKSNIMTKENFDKRIPEAIYFIKDITLNMGIYFKDDAENKVISLKEYKNYKIKLFDFLQSFNHSTMFFLGPKGCSKSVFLNMLTKALYLRNWTKLYINMKYIKQLDDAKTLKKTLYREFLYSILEEEEINKVYNWRIFDKISINENTNFVSKLIEEFIKLHQIYIKKNIVVIIDNYIIENEYEQKDLENIINYMKTQNYKKCKLIISGEGKFFSNKLRNYFLGESEKLKNEEVIFMKIQNVPKFNYFIIDEKAEKKLLLEESEYLKQYSFHSLFYCYNYDNKNISFEEFKKLVFFETFPNYLNISKEKDIIKFNLISEIYRKALNDKIEFDVQEKSLKIIMEKKYFPRTAYGIAEELLIILLLKYNKFKIPYLNFEGKNFIEVEEINNLKLAPKFVKKYNIEENKCFLITQSKYNGPNYDILIIQNIENKIRAIFVQIGVDKSKTEIQKIRTDLITNINYYKNNLQKSFNFNIDSVYLLFIFDEETQKIIPKNKLSGSKICLTNKIDFYLYSFQDYTLKKTKDLVNYNNLLLFYPVNEIFEKSETELK